MLEVLVLSLTVMQEEASTLGLQIFRRKPKSYRFSLPPQLNSPGGKWTCWSGRCICLYGMHDWLLWWQQRGGPASDWLSSVLHEYVGEEDLEVKHQAGNPVTRLSDIHCASFDVLYGCETWATTKYPLSRLDAFDTRALRKISKIPYTRHMSNAEVRGTTGCPSLSHLVTNRRLRLFGNIAHSSSPEDHHWALAAAIWQVCPTGSDQ